MQGDNIVNRLRTPVAIALTLAVVLFAFLVTPEAANHQVTISGTGSGASQNPPIAGGGVGWASCTVDRNVEEFVCQARIFNIVDLSAAHLHLGGAGANGPVVVVVPGLPTGASGALSESFTLRGTDLIARSAHGVRNFHELAYACAAGNCYLNFHTTGNPGGEIRIQLCPASAEANTFTGLAVCTTP